MTSSSPPKREVGDRYKTVLIFGAPGSGKGTQGKALGSVPRFFHCACGDVFRSLDTRTKIGQAFLDYSSRGELVPAEVTVELWQVQVCRNIINRDALLVVKLRF